MLQIPNTFPCCSKLGTCSFQLQGNSDCLTPKAAAYVQAKFSTVWPVNKKDDNDILNFALNLEFLDANFYLPASLRMVSVFVYTAKM